MVGQLKGLFPGYRYVVTFDRADGNANTFNFEITVGTTPVIGGGASIGETFRQFISAPFVANAIEMPIYSTCS